MNGYYTDYGYMGYVGGEWMLFATEDEYYEYLMICSLDSTVPMTSMYPLLKSSCLLMSLTNMRRLMRLKHHDVLLAVDGDTLNQSIYQLCGQLGITVDLFQLFRKAGVFTRQLFQFVLLFLQVLDAFNCIFKFP